MLSKVLIALPVALWAATATADADPGYPEPTNGCDTTISVCADYINECGMMYGGCFPDCKPWPTFEPPPCPSSSTWATVTTTATPEPTDPGDSLEEKCKAEGTVILCVDGIDDCGNGWGECYDVCATPSLEIPTTPCETTPAPTPTEPTEPGCADITLCVDYINECGMMYGG
ncbi:uncharacterized protein DNG_00310 [Cephalotrichum gorgonifer]|uniref:Uncharacterized protein n=1 Tax=Cephalotrichum gorgonifer TaxID=2041049 RepID=A0AAE8MNR3_9PEZI|nr:uncharacterized protein DNG_00310 [Cephalotrichum gorgonifer]